MNCEPIECPICYDTIGVTNNITTECGHKFHASCLMANITRNGFGCPCCRALMAVHPQEDEEEEDDATLLDDDSHEDDSDDDDSDDDDDDDALRGLRLFTNLLEGIEHDQEDIVAEFQYVEQIEEEIVVPSLELVAAALRAQGVTYEQLLADALMEHDEYENNMEDLERATNDLWGKLRILITNYRPAPAIAVESPVVEEAPVVALVEEDDNWIRDLETICQPIPVAAEEMFHIEHIDDNFNYLQDMEEDLYDICVNLDQHMNEVDYRAQPKIPFIHV